MEMFREQLHNEKQEYKEIEFKLESMQVEIREPPAIGNSRLVCSHCHHRGHRTRNNSSHPCQLNKCVDYTYCGLKDKHIEFQTRLNGLKLELKKKRQVIDKLEQQIQSMENFTSHSEYHFTKNLTPRLLEVDKTYKTNRVKLMRDIRMLRKFCDGKIPEITTDDAGQLKALLAKCRMTVQRDCRDYPGDDDTQTMLTNSSDINLNVSISPVQSAPTLNTEKVCDNERKCRKKKSKRRKKRSRTPCSSSSSSEDERRHRSPRRKMLFGNASANPPVFSAYNHIDPCFSVGQQMPYMNPHYAMGNVHNPYTAGLPTTQQPISFGNVIAPQHFQGVGTAMQHNFQFGDHHDRFMPASSSETDYTDKAALDILVDVANVSEKM